MLQISDFFHSHRALAHCIRHLQINKDSALLNIQEALKKIQLIQQANANHPFKECWFTLIQRSITVLAAELDCVEDFSRVREMGNRYVVKEVCERYVRLALLNGNVNEELFEAVVEEAMGVA